MSPSPTGVFTVEESASQYCFDGYLAAAIVGMFSTPPRSTADFGCGRGDYCGFFEKSGWHSVIGYEGTRHTDIQCECVKSVDLTERHDRYPRDLVLCLETGEHIPEKYEAVFLDNVCSAVGGTLILSWAVPGQGGLGHVNCLTNEDVVSKVETRGLRLNRARTIALRGAAKTYWLKHTLMVFERPAFNGFGGIFVINMDKDAQRLAETAAELSRWGVTGYERFPGVIGRVEHTEPAMARYLSGHDGCRRSHLACLELAKVRGWSSVLMIEDDIALENDFTEQATNAVEFLRSGQKWRMFYFGANHLGPTKSTKWPGIVELTGSLTTHCYAVHHTAFDEVIAALGKPKVAEVDVCLHLLHAAGGCYAVTPRLAYQRVSMSATQGAVAHYDAVLRDPR
jgi:hypothetical protein